MTIGKRIGFGANKLGQGISSGIVHSSVLLSNFLVGAGAAVNSVVGTFKTNYALTLLDNAGGKFSLWNKELRVASALAAGTNSITVRADDGTGWFRDFTFAIISLGVLAPASGLFLSTAQPGAVIATVTGLGPGEILTSIAPNDGRLAFSDNQVLVGLSASSRATIAATVTTSLGRTLSMAIEAGITPLSISGTPAAATVGSAYSFTPVVSGGYGTRTFSMTGTLPGGLSLAANTGTIDGNPSQSGSYPFSLLVTDATGTAMLSNKSIVVAALFPTPTTIMGFGDSRLQKSSALTSSGGSYSQSRVFSGGFLHSIEAVNDYLVLPGATGVYAVGASTTKNGTERLNTASNATTGSPAQTATGDSADAAYNSQATGEYSPVSDPANIVFYLYSTNDGSYPSYFTSPKKSMQEISLHLDALTGAGKVVFLANEIPRGRGFVQSEVRPVTSLACKTNSSAAVSLRRLRNRETGAIYTKVTTLTAVSQYKVMDTAGNVTFFTGDPITNAQIDYDYGNVPSGAYLNTVHNWLGSSAANFVDPDSGVDYGIPGALYGRPMVISVDTWGAMKNPATNADQTFNADGVLGDALHTNTLGSTIVGRTFMTKFKQVYPGATSKLKAITKNGYLFGTGTGALKVFTGTLPTIGMVPVTASKLKVFANGIVGVDDGAGNITGSGITGTINYTTGALSLTFTTAPAVNAKIEVYANGGENLITNGLFDPAHGAGTVTPTGVTGTPPKGWGLTVDTDLQAAITAGTVAVTLDNSQTNPRTGLPELRVRVQGTIGGTTGTAGNLTLANLVTLPANRLVTTGAGDKMRASLNYRVLPGPDGTVQSLIGVQVKGQAQSSTAVTRPGVGGAGPNTAITIGGATAGGGANATPFDDQDVTSGSFESSLLTTPVDVAAMTLGTTQHNVIIQYEKARYVSFTACISQAGLVVY